MASQQLEAKQQTTLLILKNNLHHNEQLTFIHVKNTPQSWGIYSVITILPFSNIWMLQTIQ